MSEQLIIRLQEAQASDDPVEWLVLDDRNNRIGGIQTGSLDTLGQQAGGRRVVVLVPASHVTLLTAKLPSKNPQKVMQALPFALEERLADDVGTLHFAVGAADEDGVRHVAVVRLASMNTWLNLLTEAGLSANVILPDVLALPAADREWHIAIEDETVSVRTGPTAGFATDRTLAQTMIDLRLGQLDETARPEVIKIHVADAADPTASALADTATTAEIETVETEELSFGSAISLAGTGLPAAGSFNLLQGRYKQRRYGWEKKWRQWRPVAILVAACLVLVIAWQGVAYYKMHAQQSRLHAQIVALFHRAMPNVAATGDLHGRIQSRLIQLQRATHGGAQDNLLKILGAFGSSVDSSTRLATLSWSNNVLHLQVTTPSVQALSKLRDQIKRKSGFNVTIDSASAKGKNVDGRLSIGATHETG